MRASSQHLPALILAAVTLAFSAPGRAAPGDVRHSFDAPCKYPAGLASDGTYLYVVDWRDAQIHQLSPSDGKVQQTFAAPTLRPQGLTFGNGRLFVSDSHSGWVYVLNPATGIVENMFQAPGPRVTGLAFADDALFLLERKSRQIYRVSPDDGAILASFPGPAKYSTCLAFDGTYLWVANRSKDELYMVDPDSGLVLGIVAAPGPHAAGLTWHDGHLWNVDFQTRKLYQIVINDQQPYRLTDPREARVEYLWTLYNYGPGDIRNVTLNLAVPPTLPSQELLSEIEYSVPPTQTVVDRWGQHCAVLKVEQVAAGTKLPVSYSVKAKVSAIRYLIRPEAAGTLADIPADIRVAYTADGPRYRIHTPYIQETVKKVVGDEQNPYWIARKIYNFLIDRLEYQMVGGWDVPEVVLKRGTGSCSEYTFAFIALCRAAGLPARYQGSIVVRGDDASIDEAFHRWAQVYLPNYGWVPVDANRGDAESPADQARGFGELANKFLITTQGGGDSEYLAWSYNSYATYQATGYCKLEEENFGFWEPLTAEETSSIAKDADKTGACRPD